MTVRGIRLRLKWTLLSVVDLLGFPLKLKGREGEVQIICFHGICADTDAFINGRFYHVSAFRNLLSEIQQHFHIISLDDFSANRLNPDKLNVLITFDDGYRNNLTLALPVIEELRIQYHDIPDPVIEAMLLTSHPPTEANTGIIGKVKNIQPVHQEKLDLLKKNEYRRLSMWKRKV